MWLLSQMENQCCLLYQKTNINIKTLAIFLNSACFLLLLKACLLRFTLFLKRETTSVRDPK